VQAWIAGAPADAVDAFAALLVTLKDNFLPGGNLLKIMPLKEPMDVPSGFTVPFYDGSCLLLYEVPLRTEDPIKLLLVFDPYFFSAAT
jgi:hypothetical protein